MATPLENARKKLDDEFGQVRRQLDDIHKAIDELEKAGPEAELEKLLKDLEDVVKQVRTGGLLRHGVNGHTRARKEYVELKQGR